MATISGLIHSQNSPEYIGELFVLTPDQAPLATMMGGVGGGADGDIEYTWQQTANPAVTVNAGAAEGADPTYAGVDRSQIFNVMQIFQYGFDVSYSKAGNRAFLGVSGAAPDPSLALPINPDEIAFQTRMKMLRLKRELNKTLHSGVYARPTGGANTARKMRSFEGAVDSAGTPNTIDAAAAALTKTHIEDLLQTMVDASAPLINPVLIVNSFNRRRVSSQYGTDLPRDRYVGGVRVATIVTDFADLSVVFDRDCTTSHAEVVDLAFCKLRHHPIPTKGSVFVEQMPSTGSSFKFQLYAELGFEYGLPEYHGYVDNTATA
jgi:hypothetical protein